MTNSNRAILMRIMQRNKYAITDLHQRLVIFKTIKSAADAGGDEAVEYASHNAVQYIKKELRNYVEEQKMLKGMLRDEHDVYEEVMREIDYV